MNLGTLDLLLDHLDYIYNIIIYNIYTYLYIGIYVCVHEYLGNDMHM